VFVLNLKRYEGDAGAEKMNLHQESTLGRRS
jgi:hypothetical protein